MFTTVYGARNSVPGWFDNKTSATKVRSGKMSLICFDIYIYIFIYLFFVASSTYQTATIDALASSSVDWNPL